MEVRSGGWVRMTRISWNRRAELDLTPVLKHFERWLRDQGHREEGVLTYMRATKLFLKSIKTATPSVEDAKEYHARMVKSKLARSTVNIRASALKAFYKHQGIDLTLPYMKINNRIPYFFSEDEVLAIFNSITNLKHFAMLSLMFNCMLRVSDLCSLEDDDVDLKTLSLRIRDGKFGKPALLLIPPECARTLGEYLRIRPRVEIEGRYPLFYSDLLNKFNRRSVETVLQNCKKRAGVTARGGCHVFGRHSPASIMVKNGCDIYSL